MKIKKDQETLSLENSRSRYFTCWNFVTGFWHPVDNVDSTKQARVDETSSSACTTAMMSLDDVLTNGYTQLQMNWNCTSL